MGQIQFFHQLHQQVAVVVEAKVQILRLHLLVQALLNQAVQVVVKEQDIIQVLLDQ
jgi:hypothetical protein